MEEEDRGVETEIRATARETERTKGRDNREIAETLSRETVTGFQRDLGETVRGREREGDRERQCVCVYMCGGE